MKDEYHAGPNTLAGAQDDEVRKLALSAIYWLSSTLSVRALSPSERMSELCDAYLADDPDLRHEVLLRLRQDGVSRDQIIDHILPGIARHFGDRWFADEISFADVTIGTARLQESVRALYARRPAATLGETQPRILLIIPRQEQHTLGAFIAADQFRRMGYRVDLSLDKRPKAIAALLRNQRFCMVGITASGRRTLASATELVDITRSTVTCVTPIVISGASLNSDVDVLGVTGADHTARDATTALRKCGLPIARDEPVRHWMTEQSAEGTGRW